MTEMKCRYRTGKCSNTRAVKQDGTLHNLCEAHRQKANESQRKLDRKKQAAKNMLRSPPSPVKSSVQRYSPYDQNKRIKLSNETTAKAVTSNPTSTVKKESTPHTTKRASSIVAASPQKENHIKPALHTSQQAPTSKPFAHTRKDTILTSRGRTDLMVRTLPDEKSMVLNSVTATYIPVVSPDNAADFKIDRFFNDGVFSSSTSHSSPTSVTATLSARDLAVMDKLDFCSDDGWDILMSDPLLL